MTVEVPVSRPIASGTHLLHASATAACLIALTGIALEIWTDRWFANALGVPTFLSLPLGIGAIVFCVLTFRSEQIRSAPFFVMAGLYWALFAWGSYVA